MLTLIRRLHLYLGLALVPWFLMYGVTSVAFSHGRWLASAVFDDGRPDWTTRFERPYTAPVPPGEQLRPFGEQLIRDTGIAPGAFGVYRNGNRVNVYRFDFWNATQIVYSPSEGRLRVEDRRFRWDYFLTGLHARGGFVQSSALHTAWGVLVDLACAGLLFWIASGLLLWWHVPGHRSWGSIALAAGWLSFGIFLWKL